MAEGQQDKSREDLTEEASPYRVEELRRQGSVAQSKELSAVLVLIAVTMTLWFTGPRMGSHLVDFMREVFRTDLSARLDLGSTSIGRTTFIRAVLLTASLALPICIAGFITGILGSFAQVGAIFSWDPIQPDASRVSPLAGFGRIVSMKNATEGAKTLIKATVFLVVAYGLVKTEVLNMPNQVGQESTVILAHCVRIAKSIFTAMIIVFSIFSAIDYALQRWEFSKSVRLTKQEAKQEFKEREGDPQIRARVRSIQREQARKRMMEAVKKADVIVTNPTHIAIAVAYDREKMNAPVVLAKGADFVAQKIKEIAATAGVPFVENVPLARTLFKTVKVGQVIPRALYQAVAEILAYVYRLKGKTLR